VTFLSSPKIFALRRKYLVLILLLRTELKALGVMLTVHEPKEFQIS
jgi:hypothetical protein